MSSPGPHLMKCSHSTVRLLVRLVAHVDALDNSSNPNPSRKLPSALHGKGKWKTVSRLMLEKGLHVSPQQCEDKFNYLNKRYKRLIEILGPGTACEVVEKPCLLDSMADVSNQAKEDVRRMLSSKQLFYREMCAYHNGEMIPEDAELCRIGAFLDVKISDYCNLERIPNFDEEDENEDDDREEEDDNEKARNEVLERFMAEMDDVVNDKSKTTRELKEWFQRRAGELQEERVGIDVEALEVQKRLFQWEKFRSEKDREVERLRLENERLMIENQQMMMLAREKETELEIRANRNQSEQIGLQMESADNRIF